MKRFVLIALLALPLAWPAPGYSADKAPRRLLTAVDLLKSKGLTTFSPACIIGTSTGGLVTAEDLLRAKGLLGGPANGEKTAPEEEDIWGMGQDFGC